MFWAAHPYLKVDPFNRNCYPTITLLLSGSRGIQIKQQEPVNTDNNNSTATVYSEWLLSIHKKTKKNETYRASRFVVGWPLTTSGYHDGGSYERTRTRCDHT